MAEINFTIKKGGRVVVEAAGFEGPACLEATRTFIERLGLKASEELKAEAFTTPRLSNNDFLKEC